MNRKWTAENNWSLVAVPCTCTRCDCPEKAAAGDPICMWCENAARTNRSCFEVSHPTRVAAQSGLPVERA